MSTNLLLREMLGGQLSNPSSLTTDNTEHCVYIFDEQDHDQEGFILVAERGNDQCVNTLAQRSTGSNLYIMLLGPMDLMMVTLYDVLMRDNCPYH